MKPRHGGKRFGFKTVGEMTPRQRAHWHLTPLKADEVPANRRERRDAEKRQRKS